MKTRILFLIFVTVILLSGCDLLKKEDKAPTTNNNNNNNGAPPRPSLQQPPEPPAEQPRPAGIQCMNDDDGVPPSENKPCNDASCWCADALDISKGHMCSCTDNKPNKNGFQMMAYDYGRVRSFEYKVTLMANGAQSFASSVSNVAQQMVNGSTVNVVTTQAGGFATKIYIDDTNRCIQSQVVKNGQATEIPCVRRDRSGVSGVLDFTRNGTRPILVPAGNFTADYYVSQDKGEFWIADGIPVPVKTDYIVMGNRTIMELVSWS